jgi:uncharacterized membrane protein YhfC
MVLLAHLSSALLTLLLPFALGAAIQRRLGAPWGLFGAGTLTFVASQVVHIPLNVAVAAAFASGWVPLPSAKVAAVLVPLGLGLSAGLCEEVTRWVAVRRWVDARTWSRGLMFGAGHGGIEALLVGFIALAAWFQLVAIHDNVARLSPETATLAKAQADAYFGVPLAMTLLVLFERAGALCVHLGCTSLVVRAASGRPALLVAAIALHAAVDAGAVWLVQYGVLVAEAWVGVIAIASLGVVALLRRPDPPAVQPEPIRPVKPRKTPLVSGDAVDDSRYQ